MVKSLRLYSENTLGRKARLERQAWALRHLTACSGAEGPELPILALTHAIAVAVNHHEGMYGSVDYILGGAVGDMIEAGRAMLNFDLGRLDAATIDSWLLYVADEIGYDANTSEWTGQKANV